MVLQESTLPLSKYHKKSTKFVPFLSRFSSFYTISYRHLEKLNENRYYIKYNYMATFIITFLQFYDLFLFL